MAAIGSLPLALALAGGCQQKLDPQEYGQIIPDLPKIKGAQKRYPLPQLEEPEESQPEGQK
jgi:hypothetical protein